MGRGCGDVLSVRGFHPAGGSRLRIAAWGVAFEGGRTFGGAARPRLAVRADVVSGDTNPSDHRLGTFDLPYPNLSYLSDAVLFAPRNVRDLQPFVGVSPCRTLTVTAGSEFLWRTSIRDAVFSP